MVRTQRLLILITLVSAVVILACLFTPAQRVTSQQVATPTVTHTPKTTPFPDLVLTLTLDRLAKPKSSMPPTQADKGAEYYWLVCIPCHGDHGQGLTDEWRVVFGPEEMNCWQSECHGKRHPPEGFELPRKVPPVLGPNTLTRYANAAELHHIISTAMPWYDPKSLSVEDGWNVTAFLLRESGVLPAGVTLTEANAPVFRLRTPAPYNADEHPVTLVVIGLLSIAALLFFWQILRRH